MVNVLQPTGIEKPEGPEQHSLALVNRNYDRTNKIAQDFEAVAQPFGHMGKTDGFQDINPAAVVTMAAAQILRGGITFDNATDSLVIPKDGLYRVAVKGYYSGGTVPSRAEMLARKVTGTVSLYGSRVSVSKPDSSDYYDYSEGVHELNAGDKIQIYASGSSTAGSAWGTDGYNGVYLEVEWKGTA